jgi:predicted SAM-dependent methyltransferase
MTFEFSPYPRKINLGCGLDKRNGFLNVDIHASHEPDLICDVTNLQDLPSSYFEYMLANDILEHIPRLKIRNTLKEWNRILIKHGRLDLRVPSAIGLLSLLQMEKNRTPAAHEKLLQCLFGTQSYHGDFHYIAFTEVVLEDMLIDAGFAIESMEVKDEWLFVVSARKSNDRSVNEIFFLNDEEFIIAVYSSLLARKPDQCGFEHYLGLIKSGIAREALIESIKDSEEYRLKTLTKKVVQERH